MCWPETRVNQTVFLPCPDYLNKFNKLGNDFNIQLKYKFNLMKFILLFIKEKPLKLVIQIQIEVRNQFGQKPIIHYA